MYPCPRCRMQAFDAGRCAQCGYADPRVAGVRIVSGQVATQPTAPAAPEPPPLALDPSALVEVAEDAGPSLPGFESTALVSSPSPRPSAAPAAPKSDEDEFVYSTCPRCRSPQPDPPETFCGHCGYRVKQRLRAKEAEAKGEGASCRDCGTINEPGLSKCVNCGFPLPSEG